MFYTLFSLTGEGTLRCVSPRFHSLPLSLSGIASPKLTLKVRYVPKLILSNSSITFAAFFLRSPYLPLLAYIVIKSIFGYLIDFW